MTINEVLAFTSLVVASQAYFLLFLVASIPSRNRLAKYFLEGYIATKGTQMLLFYFLSSEIGFPDWAAILHNVEILTGPLLYMYVRAMVSSNFHLRWWHGLHFLPVIIFPLILMLLIGSFPSTLLAEDEWPLSLKIYNLVHLVWLMIYLVAAKRLLPEYERLIRGNVSSINEISFEWLHQLIIAFLGATLFLFLLRFTSILTLREFNYGWLTALNIGIHVVFFYLIAIGCYRQRSIFEIQVEVTETPEKPPDKGSKYKRSAISEERGKVIWEMVKSYIQEHEPYLDNDLNLAQLAGMVGFSSHELSQVFNRFSDKNFYEFINGYRAHKARELIEKEAGSRKSLLALAMDAGFANKGTFYKHFKKHFNITPAEYRKSCQKLVTGS